MANTSEKQAEATSKARYLVAVFSVVIRYSVDETNQLLSKLIELYLCWQLVVCIVAVLVVTVASQARNTKQQQEIDDSNEALLSSFGGDQPDLRHPRFISRPIISNSSRAVISHETSVILESLKALVMRVVTPTLNETVSNASGQVVQGVLSDLDIQPGYAGVSKVIVRRK